MQHVAPSTASISQACSLSIAYISLPCIKLLQRAVVLYKVSLSYSYAPSFSSRAKCFITLAEQLFRGSSFCDGCHFLRGGKYLSTLTTPNVTIEYFYWICHLSFPVPFPRDIKLCTRRYITGSTSNRNRPGRAQLIGSACKLCISPLYFNIKES